MKTSVLQKFKRLFAEYIRFDGRKIPLCAAENYVSPFVKQALTSILEGKYVMGSDRDTDNNEFIGSKYLRKIYKLITEECAALFGSKYSDARTLTGMNCDMLVLMSLASSGDRMLLTTPEQGGHASVPKIADKLGIFYDGIPFDFDKYSIDYDACNDLLATGKYKYIMFCQSDLIETPDFSKLKIPEDVILLYDGTQTLGLIAAGLCLNPLNYHAKTMLFGGTHKTLPGPACGIILSNDEGLMEKIDKKINPDYLRNTQINNVAGLLLALIEQERCGKKYQQKILETANSLAAKLKDEGFDVAVTADGAFTHTHQIFLLCNKTEQEITYKNAERFCVTMNMKNKPLFRGYGLRLGVQEIARYGWNERDLSRLARLICLLKEKSPDERKITAIIQRLAKRKTPKYLLNDEFMITE